MQANNPSGVIGRLDQMFEGRIPTTYEFRPEINVRHFAFDFPSSALAMLNENIINLTSAVENLTERIRVLEQWFEQFVPSFYEPREIDIEGAKREIKSKFEAMHGETIFPSEIAEDLRLDYDLVVRALTDLENEGQIKSVDKTNNGGDAS